MTTVHTEARWWTGAKRAGQTLAGREALLVLGAGAAVQLVMRYRTDLPSHVVGGGGLSLLVASLVPVAWARRLGPLFTTAVFAVVGGAALVTDAFVYGPFDQVDVAFTMAGALVASEAATEITSSPATVRRYVAVVGLGLMFLGWAYRAITMNGPTL